MSLSPNYALLICGRIVTGLGIGAGLVVVPVYVAELSPSIWRGRMVALIEVW